MSPTQQPPSAAVADEATSPLLPATMTAVVQRHYGEVAAEVLSLAEVPVPTPGKGEVLLRMRASAVDRGVWHLMAGTPKAVRVAFGLRHPKHPVPGLDVAGTVVALGPGVTELGVGDEVFGVGRGAYAQYAVAPVAKVVRRPVGIPVEQAAAVPISGMTAIQAIRDHAQVQAGERVLVLGASGGVGTYLVQMARAAGAHVTGVCSGPKADLVRALGADEVLDHASDTWLTDGSRFDVILDGGGNHRLRDLRGALTEHGRLVIVGGEGGGSLFGGLDRQFRAKAWSPFLHQTLTFLVSREDGADVEAVGEMILAGQVTPAVDRTFPLADIAAAVDHLGSGQARGKVVITI
jgi:NADPH:quinone reductase-like Zn-dependent oxidoreductase